MKYRIDQGDPAAGVVVALCACGSRFLAFNRAGALVRLAAHERGHHPADKNARADLAKLRRAERTPKIQPTSQG